MKSILFTALLSTILLTTAAYAGTAEQTSHMSNTPANGGPTVHQAAESTHSHSASSEVCVSCIGGH